jgi:hypothetical protein
LLINPKIQYGQAWGFQFILHPLAALLHFNIFSLRITRLALYLSATFYLSFSLLSLIPEQKMWNKNFKPVLFALLGIPGIFITYSYPPRALGYNELSSIICCLVCALLIGQIRSEYKDIDYLKLITLGLLLGALFFVKFTSFILISFFAFLVILIKNKRKFFSVLIPISSCSTLLLILGLSSDFPLKYIRNLTSLAFNKNLQQRYGHPITSMISVDLNVILNDLKSFFITASIFYLTISIMRYVFRNSPKFLILNQYVLAMLAGLIFYLANQYSPINKWSSTGRILTTLLFASILLIWLSMQRENCLTFENSWLLCILCVFPVFAALGTNNPIDGQLIYTAPVIIAFFSFASILYISPVFVEFVSSLLVLSLMILSLHMLRVDTFTSPYRSAPYFQQKHVTLANTPLSGLKLNEGDVTWVDWIINSSHKIEPETKVISINNPAVPLILNGRYFSTPWIGAFWPVNYDAIAAQCKLQPQPAKLALYIEGMLDLTDSTELNIALKPCLVEFPRSFSLIAKTEMQTTSHTTSLWKS